MLKRRKFNIYNEKTENRKTEKQQLFIEITAVFQTEKDLRKQEWPGKGSVFVCMSQNVSI